MFQDKATLKFQGRKLDKKDFFGKSDPYLLFYRCNEDDRYLRTKLFYQIKEFQVSNTFLGAHYLSHIYVRPHHKMSSIVRLNLDNHQNRCKVIFFY